MRRVTPALLIILVLGSPLDIRGQEQDETPPPGFDDPIPYDPEEFPQWSRDLRRGEIIALGAFPIAMIVSGLGYQVGRFAYQSIAAGELSQEYAPGFFSPQGGARYTEQERVGLIVSGAVISLGIAVADYLLGRREARER